jgi:hypothetical protein
MSARTRLGSGGGFQGVLKVLQCYKAFHYWVKCTFKVLQRCYVRHEVVSFTA